MNCKDALMTTDFTDGDIAEWFGIEIVTSDVFCSSRAQFAGNTFKLIQCQNALYRML